jgi:hypothetical protein
MVGRWTGSIGVGVLVVGLAMGGCGRGGDSGVSASERGGTAPSPDTSAPEPGASAPGPDTSAPERGTGPDESHDADAARSDAGASAPVPPPAPGRTADGSAPGGAAPSGTAAGHGRPPMTEPAGSPRPEPAVPEPPAPRPAEKPYVKGLELPIGNRSTVYSGTKQCVGVGILRHILPDGVRIEVSGPPMFVKGNTVFKVVSEPCPGPDCRSFSFTREQDECWVAVEQISHHEDDTAELAMSGNLYCGPAPADVCADFGGWLQDNSLTIEFVVPFVPDSPSMTTTTGGS